MLREHRPQALPDRPREIEIVRPHRVVGDLRAAGPAPGSEVGRGPQTVLPHAVGSASEPGVEQVGDEAQGRRGRRATENGQSWIHDGDVTSKVR